MVRKLGFSNISYDFHVMILKIARTYLFDGIYFEDYSKLQIWRLWALLSRYWQAATVISCRCRNVRHSLIWIWWVKTSTEWLARLTWLTYNKAIIILDSCCWLVYSVQLTNDHNFIIPVFLFTIFSRRFMDLVWILCMKGIKNTIQLK